MGYRYADATDEIIGSAISLHFGKEEKHTWRVDQDKKVKSNRENTYYITVLQGNNIVHVSPPLLGWRKDQIPISELMRFSKDLFSK